MNEIIKLKASYLISTLELDGFKPVYTNENGLFLVCEKPSGAYIHINFGHDAMNMWVYLKQGEELMKLLMISSEFRVCQRTFWFPVQLEENKFFSILDKQESEIRLRQREIESGFSVPVEIENQFKSYLTGITKPLLESFSTLVGCYNFFEGSIRDSGIINYLPSSGERLAFKALVGASDYEYYKAFFLNVYQVEPEFFDFTTEDKIRQFVSAMDKVNSEVDVAVKSAEKVQGAYVLSDAEIAETQKGMIYFEISRVERIRDGYLLIAESERTNYQRSELEKIPNRLNELRYKLRELDILKEDVLANPGFDHFEYYEKYNNKQPYERAIGNMQQMSYVRKAIDLTLKMNPK